MLPDLFVGLAERGIPTRVLTSDHRLPAILEGRPVEVRVADALRGWRQWRLHSYLRRVFERPPDVVHAWGTAGLSYLSDWTLHNNAALVVHLTSQADVERVLRRGVYANETLLALCCAYRDRLARRWPGLGAALDVAPPGVRIPAAPEPPSPRGRTLGVIWVGRFEAASGLDVLIEAVARVASQGTDVQAVLIGTGPDTHAVWQAIERKRVARCFSLIADPLVWNRTITGADACVVPAATTAVSLAPLVAMAHARIVVASRDQEADGFIEDRTCLQFEPGSAVELAFHLQRAAVGHRQVIAVARSAATYAREHYDMTWLLSRLAALYQDLAGRAPSGEPQPGAMS